MVRGHLTGTRLGIVLAVVAGVLLGAVFGQPGSGRAASSATKPVNKTPPAITGTAEVGQKLVATRGTWSGNPTSFSYVWSRCDPDGACITIAGATGKPVTGKSYLVSPSDVGHTLVVTVTAHNAAGSTAKASAPTATVPPSGCPGGTGAVLVTQIAPPARLEIAAASLTSPVTRASRSIHVHVAITACNGRPVQGATVFATAIPYNQFTSVQQTTAADGTVTIAEARRGGFPASSHQRLLAVFVRATKPGESALDGVSSRRLVAFRFGHH